MDMYIKTIALGLAIMGGLALAPCELAARDKKPVIAATNAPVERLLRKIAGDRMEVRVLTPPGADSHTHAMRPDDYRAASRALTVVMNGADMEVAMSRGLKLQRDRLDSSKGLDLIRASKMLINPHIWLDPVLLQQQGRIITDKLIDLDPGAKQDYERNYKSLYRLLDGMDAYARDKLAPHKGKLLVTHHDAFAYLARRYGLKYQALSGTHHGRPLPGRLKDIYNMVREEKVPAVFSDTIYHSKAFARLSKDLDVRVCSLDTLVAGNDIDEFNIAYRRNIDTIAECLEGPAAAAKDGANAR